jgi:molecular chaperone HscB
MEAHPCWRCGHDSEEAPEAPSLFCTYCNTLQAPTPDYYRFFGLPRRLELDTGDLQRRFYSLSRLLHPDRYTRRPERERTYSLEATAILNDGYRVLRDPVLRAGYVLREAGFEGGEQRNQDVPPELLEQVFELNMALDELRSGDENAAPLLHESRRKFAGMQEKLDAELRFHFARHDAASDVQSRQKALLAIRGVLNRRRYIQNLLGEVGKELVERGI